MFGILKYFRHAPSITSQLCIRWIVKSDLPAVIQIETASFEYPWDEELFIRLMKNRSCNTVCLVATYKEEIVGYIVYEVHKTHYHILNLAIAEKHRRKGIASCILSLLTKKMTKERKRIMCEVRETNLVGHLLLRKNGFKAIEMLKDFYDGVDEDAIIFLKGAPCQEELLD